MNRPGYDWSVFGDIDPTPGDVAAVTAASRAVADQADQAATNLAALDTAGVTIGAGDWTGQTATAFTAALQTLLPDALAHQAATTAAAEALAGWAATLEGLQGECDSLYSQAIATRDQRDATNDQAGRQAQTVAAARQQLQAATAAGDPVAISQARNRHLDAARTLDGLRQTAANLTRDLDRLQAAAQDLASRHVASEGVYADAVGEARLPAPNATAFTGRVGNAILAAAVPGIVPDSGLLGPAEAAALIDAVLDLPPGEARSDAVAGLKLALDALAAQPGMAAAIIAHIGTDKVEEIYGDILAVGYNDPAGTDAPGILDAFNGIVAVASHDPQIAETLTAMVQAAGAVHDQHDLAVLAGIGRAVGLADDVALALAAAVTAAMPTLEALPHLGPTHGTNSAFPELVAHPEALLAVVLGHHPAAATSVLVDDSGLNDDMLAIVLALGGDGVDGLVGANIGAAVGHLLAGADDPDAMAIAIAEAIKEHGIAADGAPTLIELAPHIDALVDHAMAGPGQQWLGELFTILLSGTTVEGAVAVTAALLDGSVDIMADAVSPASDWAIADQAGRELAHALRPAFQSLKLAIEAAMNASNAVGDSIDAVLDAALAIIPVKLPGIQQLIYNAVKYVITQHDFNQPGLNSAQFVDQTTEALGGLVGQVLADNPAALEGFNEASVGYGQPVPAGATAEQIAAMDLEYMDNITLVLAMELEQILNLDPPQGVGQ